MTLLEKVRRWNELRSQRGVGAAMKSTGECLVNRPRLLLHPVVDWRYIIRHGKGTEVMPEEWDNLLLLDACRYDFFEKRNTVEGRLEGRFSRGTMSWDFMEENFVGETLHDTVYVTANPYVDDLPEGIFHAIDDSPLTDGWSDEKGTSLPETVTEAALRAGEEYPHKRLIVHYMQPHRPYLGETARQIYQRLPRMEDTFSEVGKEVTEDELRSAYGETLEIALNEVERLLETVGGRSVVSSDHGELLGERPHPLLEPMFGHGFPRCEELCKVPWLVVEGDGRRDVRADPPITGSELDEETVKDRLEALGYR